MKKCITLTVFFLAPLFLFSQNKVERIEPPNWWIGMSNPHVQLLIYGDNISQFEPKINYKGVTLERVIRTDNPNYLFLDLYISEKAPPGGVFIYFMSGEEVIEYHSWQLNKRKNGASEIKGFDNSDVLYLITPDRFANGNPDNDNMDNMREKADRSNPIGRHGGDIVGIRNSLDYIGDMGFTAIWLNPLLENNMDRLSYHGYSTTDFYKVDPRFGSNEEYKLLIEEAAGKDIQIIMDMIVNHCGSQHWWHDDLPAKDWYNKEIGYYSNHLKSATQDPYAAAVDKEQFYDGWFDTTMPDLNQRNPLLATYLIQNSIWWIEYAKVGGIRMDTYPYPEPDFMADWTKAVMAEYPNFNVVGEEWNDNPNIVAYWQKGKINPDGYVSELPSLMDFPLQIAMAKALTEKETWGKGWIKVYEMLANDHIYADPMDLVIFPDNHDMPRFYAQMGGDINLVKMGLVYVLTMRGTPQLYYGTEIMMDSPAERNDGLIRSDFPGGWEGDGRSAFSGKNLTEGEKDMQSFLKKLLNWRKNATVIHHGKLVHFAPKDGVYVYFRYDEKNKVMVVLNKNKEPYELDLSRFSEVLDGEEKATDVISGKEYEMGGKIQLAENGPMVLEFKG